MRRSEERKAAAKAVPAAVRPAVGDTWRRGGAPTPATPARSGTSSPRPTPESPSLVQRTRPPLFASHPDSGGGWRAREAAKASGSTTAVADTTSNTANGEPEAPKPSGGDEDGFQTVPSKRQVWRPKRGRGT